MTPNDKLIQHFYVSFQNKDFQAMQECYHSEATFNDEVFKNLSYKEVKAMWHMLCERAKDLKIDFHNINANDLEGSCDWDATYLFSKTGRTIHNIIHAEFKMRNGKFFSHVDSFDLNKWMGMAMGPLGIILGWTSFFKNKVRKTARESLEFFIAKHPEYQ